MRVYHIDPDNCVAYLKLGDGKTARVSGPGVEDLSVNDVVFATGDDWRKVSKGVWPPSFQVSIIREVLDDGTILGEFGNVLLRLFNPHDVEISIDSTVEIDGSSVIIRRISENPIRVQQHIGDEVGKVTDFLNPDAGNLSFDDFGGYEKVVERAKELIETQLNRREELRKIGAKPIKGILFSGPPGTGKTHLAKIIANKADANFYEIGGPAIVSKYVGDSEELLRKIFKHAADSESGKSIIFFDEIDSIAENRSGNTHDSSRKLVAQFLTLMDGFQNTEATIIVIAATNRVDVLDPALTRPGRFDWEIEFGLPTLLDRLEILRVGSRRIRCAKDLPLTELALKTPRWSAARLTSIWTEASLIAASDGRVEIAGEDLAQGYERVLLRPERESGGNSTS